MKSFRSTAGIAAGIAIASLTILGSGKCVAQANSSDAVKTAKASDATSKTATISINPASKNVLMGSDAELKGGLKEQWPGQAARFFVSGWTSNEDSFTWNVRVPEAGDYSVALMEVNCGKILIDCKLAEPPTVPVVVLDAASKLETSIPYRKAAITNEWMREDMPGLLHLSAGESKITLHAAAAAGSQFNLALYSLELTKPSTQKILTEEAAKLRSSTKWMQDAKYGLMFTWTAATVPQHGPKKSYAEAVQDFDVNAFANMVAGTGAGFVVFCTSWADYYFPGPIASWDRVAPGHTTQRDLIKDLADALNARGIKLMIYYHAGRDEKEKDWWAGGGARKMDKDAYFREWKGQIREIGLRYGDKLAGFWFDDGLTFYYPMEPNWKEFTEAAKAGNPARVVGYNSWIFPKATDFQDYACGEGGFPDRMNGDGEVPVGGNGIFVSGPQKGLQATLTVTNEAGNWGHTTLDTPVPAPQLSTPVMIEDIRTAVERKIVPIINLEVYQDGSAGPATIEEFKAIKAAIKPSSSVAAKLEGKTGN